MADKDLEQRLQQLTLENAALQQKLTNFGSASESSPKSEEQAVCKVAVKLPPFWPDKPAVWFGQHGRDYEKIALDQLSIQDVEIRPYGLFIDPEIPYLGATPDGLIKEEAIVDVKCPISAHKIYA
ncbi:unnamed protein product, partial [Brenthis ino]